MHEIHFVLQAPLRSTSLTNLKVQRSASIAAQFALANTDNMDKNADTNAPDIWAAAVRRGRTLACALNSHMPVIITCRVGDTP